MSATKKLNHSEVMALLNCRRLPAQLTAAEAAVLLRFEESNIPIIALAKLLKPLGNPSPNAEKLYWTNDILAAAANREWLSKARIAISQYWKDKNQRKKNKIG